MIVEICSICGEEFVIGVNGTVDGCDLCQGICRDKNGYAWLPDEKEHTYRPIGAKDNSQDFVITREDAFGIKNN